MATARWLWLDAFRGLAVLGMTFVNAGIYLHDVLGAATPAPLLHSAWAGFTVADAVFPAFVFAVGISASVAFRPERPPTSTVRRILLRTAVLFALGLFVSNLDLIERVPDATFRVMGVLQRIALVYAAVGVTVVFASPAVWAFAALALLIVYAIGLSLPPPGGLLDLTRPGLDLPAWFDRTAAPGMLYMNGPQGFDPEGLLSTLPAIAQGLLGALVGRYVSKMRRAAAPLGGLAVAAIALGLALAPLEPIVKALWTPTFVLLSTGVSILLAMALMAIERTAVGSLSLRPAAALGRNAIVAYLLQEVCADLLKWAPLGWGALVQLSPPAVAVADALLFTGLMGAPVLVLARGGRAVRA